MQSTTTNLEARIAELEQRVRELEAEQDEFGIVPMLRRIFPAETRKHMRAAQREQLLAFRSFIDRWIERSEEEPTARRETIRID